MRTGEVLEKRVERAVRLHLLCVHITQGVPGGLVRCILEVQVSKH